MKKLIVFPILLGLAALLIACNPVADTTIKTDDEPSSSTNTEEPATNNTDNTDNNGMGMMGRGMGGGMMARHHATVPEEYAGLSNPISADDASIERGGDIYVTHCATCHGDGGMGDGPAAAGMDPAPAAIAHTSQMLGDDYLYWRISEGGHMFDSAMVAWGGILDEDTRWDVINYIQALGIGAAMPRESMGGDLFDPEVQAAQQAQMLADAVAQGIITEEEAATFATAHEVVDGQMIKMREAGASESMDDMMADILVELVSAGELTQEQADTFMSVHDRLGEAGLMQ